MIACQVPAVARPSVIASSAAYAAGNHGSSWRGRTVARRTSPETGMPTAHTLGVISASLPTRSGWRPTYSAARFTPPE